MDVKNMTEDELNELITSNCLEIESLKAELKKFKESPTYSWTMNDDSPLYTVNPCSWDAINTPHIMCTH